MPGVPSKKQLTTFQATIEGIAGTAVLTKVPPAPKMAALAEAAPRKGTNVAGVVPVEPVARISLPEAPIPLALPQ